MAYSFNGEEDADEMMQALFSLAGKCCIYGISREVDYIFTTIFLR